MMSASHVSEYLNENAALVLLGSVAAWFLLFGVLERVVRAVTAGSGLVLDAAPTTPPQEKPTTVQGYAFLALSTLHSSTVATLVVYTLPTVLLGEGGGEREVAAAGGDATHADVFAELKFGAIVGDPRAVLTIAGYTYTSWALFEVLFFSLHWRVFGKVSDMFHHVLFATTGLFFMANPHECGYYAAVLMAMEVSTPWLNLHLAFRGSGGEYRRVLGKAAGIVYFLTMICFRVAIPAVVLVRFVSAFLSNPLTGLTVTLASPHGLAVVVLFTIQALSLGLQSYWLSTLLLKLCGPAHSAAGRKQRIRDKRAAAMAGRDKVPLKHD